MQCRVQPDQGKLQQVSELPQASYFVTAYPSLNIRTAPGLEGTIITQVKNGDRVDVICDVGNGWYRVIAHYFTVGFAFAQYLNFEYGKLYHCIHPHLLQL